MNLESAFTLFRRLGIDVPSLSRKEFSNLYFGLARRYHPDRNPATEELMANINMARTCIFRTYRWPEEARQAAEADRAPARSAGQQRPAHPRPDHARTTQPVFGRWIWPTAAEA